MQDEAEEQLARKRTCAPATKARARPQSARRARNTSHRSPFISRISKRKVSGTSHKPPAVCIGNGEFTNYLSRQVFLIALQCSCTCS